MVLLLGRERGVGTGCTNICSSPETSSFCFVFNYSILCIQYRSIKESQVVGVGIMVMKRGLVSGS